MQRCKSILTDLPLHCLNYVDKNDSRLHIYTLFDANTCRDFASCVVFFPGPEGASSKNRTNCKRRMRMTKTKKDSTVQLRGLNYTLCKMALTK